MQLNCSKTKTVLIDGQRLGKPLSNEDRKFEIELDCCKLEHAERVKLFGLELDEQLSFFHVYIDCLWSRLSKRIGTFNRIKAYLPRPSVYCNSNIVAYAYGYHITSSLTSKDAYWPIRELWVLAQIT